ncbi:MAG: HAD family hydrolase [Clostridia bacterium]
MLIKGVIFDLDGTILNTLDDLAAAMNRMLAGFGYPLRTDLEYQKQALGYGARHYVKTCMPPEAAADEAKVDACLAAYVTEYQAHANAKTRPYDGITEVMAFLTAANIKINVLSNKPDEATRALVTSWFSDYPLSFVFGERPGMPRKPDPKAALAIAEQLSLLPEEMAFIGDSSVDIQTGLNAGMTPIGVLWGFRSEEQLLQGGAKLLAKTPADLISLINNC